MVTDRRRLKAAILTACIAAAMYFVFLLLLTPQFHSGKVSIASHHEQQKAFTFPLQFARNFQTVRVSALMEIGPLHGTRFTFTPDDCLDELIVNGVVLPHNGFRTCDYTKGQDVSLGTLLHAGTNTIEAVVKNDGGGGSLRIRLSNWDTVLLLFRIVFLTVLCIAAWNACRSLRLSRQMWVFLGIIAFGVLIRYLYLLQTPYFIRAYDQEGHLEYLWYVLTHWTIPHFSLGWQTYQPPLYYFFSALVLWPLHALGYDHMFLTDIFLFQSFLLSSAWLVVILWIARMLFMRASEWWMAALFLLTASVFPGAVYMAAWPSNDVPVLLLSTLSLGFLLRWWQKGKSRDWYIACILLGLGILTKSSILPLLPVAGICLFAKRRSFRSRKAFRRALLISAAIFLILTGWYYTYRFLGDGQQHIVGNLAQNHHQLFVDYWEPHYLFTFDPFRFLAKPYTTPWEPMTGREYFWEHFIKSAITTEYNFGYKANAIVRFILALSLILLPFGCFAALSEILRDPRRNLPIWLSFAFPVLAAMALMWQTWNGGFQHFRYIPVVFVPVTYAVLHGIERLPGWMKTAGQGMLIGFCVLCVLFLHVLVYV